MTFTG